MLCPLCQTENPTQFFDGYYLCGECDLRFIDPQLRLSWDEEAKRYDLHDNRSEDPAYQDFIRPVTDAIQQRLPKTASGLDFGCGSDSAVMRVLSEAGYSVVGYDPKYFPDMNAFGRTYDFITATEVIEHLHSPITEFAKIRELLNPGGVLAVMTHFYSKQIDFEFWYYRRDPTHVCFYSHKTLHWIQRRFHFRAVEILTDRAAVFLV